MICENSFENCLATKIEYKSKCDLFLQCSKCLSGRAKSLDDCCTSPDKLFVNLPRADGKPTKREYCRNCGSTSAVIKMNPVTEHIALPLLSKDVQNATQTARREKQMNFYAFIKKSKDEAIQKENDEFKERYHNYLKTKEWASRRIKVLKRDQFICQGCLKNKATQVHHTTYQHIFNEPLFELVSVCDECHNKIHEIAN
jgi:hypothetical protein